MIFCYKSQLCSSFYLLLSAGYQFSILDVPVVRQSHDVSSFYLTESLIIDFLIINIGYPTMNNKIRWNIKRFKEIKLENSIFL